VKKKKKKEKKRERERKGSWAAGSWAEREGRGKSVGVLGFKDFSKSKQYKPFSKNFKDF
jgi:hypothetical protein